MAERKKERPPLISMLRSCVASLLVVHGLAQGMQAASSADEPRVDIPEDIACDRGPNAAAWSSVKKRFRALLEESSGPFRLAPRETVQKVLQESIEDISNVGGFSNNVREECGFGKLFIQVLSVVTMEDSLAVAQFLQDTPVMSSPMLTILLDIPWVATALSGWPFFGILSQVAMHKVDLMKGALNNDAVDGLSDETAKAYFREVYEAAPNSDLARMAQASFAYMASTTAGSSDVLGQLTAMATQAAVQTDVKQRMDTVQALQRMFRNVIATPSELDIALTTRWPLWGVLHVAVDAFAPA